MAIKDNVSFEKAIKAYYNSFDVKIIDRRGVPTPNKFIILSFEVKPKCIAIHTTFLTYD